MLRVGGTAPTFTLPGATGGTVDDHSLADYLDSDWHVVLVFYPFDFHPTCVSQWCALRDADWLTFLDHVAVLGVSTDSAHAHRAFAEAHDLDFPLLSDPSGRVPEAYGVLVDEFEGHREVAELALFVVDPDRVVQYAWVGESPADEPDFDAVERATNCRGGVCGTDDADAGAGGDATGDADARGRGS